MRRSSTAILVGAALFATGCATNPATGGRMLSLVSESQEIQMGQQYREQIPAQMGLYDDAALQSYVDSVGQALAAASERPNLPWSFQVVDDPVVNAFALPGGPIYLARGIMAYFNSEAEMASVLGHEIGHVTARHAVEQISRQQLAQIGFVAGMIAVPELRPFGDALSGGLGLLFLQYGREDESQSDMLGHRYMTRLGYDPQGAVGMFQILEGQQRAAGGSPLPEWQSSHPDPGNRLEAARRRVVEDGDPGGIVRREEYLRRIDGLVYGPDPRQGYFREDTFVHPELEFRLDFPGGWRRQNTPAAVVALSPERDALIELGAEPGKTASQAADAFAQIDGMEIVGSSNRTVNGLPALVGRFRVQNDPRDSRSVLEGLVMFVEKGDLTYRLIGYTSSQRFGSYAPTFERVLGSFATEADRTLLDVEPKRVQIVEVPEAMSADRFTERFPSTIPPEDVLLLNGWEPATRLEPGELAKRVVGTGGPR